MGVSGSDADWGEGYSAGAKAERERCAKIAESFKPGFCGDDKDVQRYELAEAIAAAIRLNG